MENEKNIIIYSNKLKIKFLEKYNKLLNLITIYSEDDIHYKELLINELNIINNNLKELIYQDYNKNNLLKKKEEEKEMKDSISKFLPWISYYHLLKIK